MERVIDLHIRSELESSIPLHHTQFAYLKGKSTVTALHHLVSKIETSFRCKEVALCAFLDIEEAFNNTGYDSITHALRCRNMDALTINWIRAMLMHRNISASWGATSVSIRAVGGCPQGGVLSPLLWSLVIDDLLYQLHERGLTTIRYTDDLVVVVS